MAPPVCEAAAAAAAAAATAAAAPAEADEEPRLARAPPPPVADRGAVVVAVALPLPPPPCYNNDSTKEQNVIDQYNIVPAVILHSLHTHTEQTRELQETLETGTERKSMWNILARKQRKTDKSCRRRTTGWHESAKPGKRI